MASTTGTDKDKRLESIVRDAGGELQALRNELSRYKIIFDSARLIVGHEFRKPLTSITGYIELLQTDLGERMNEKERRYFEKIREAADRLAELIESFIQTLRFESSDKDAQDVEQVDLFRLVEHVKERLGAAADVVENAIDRNFPRLLLRKGSIEVVLENLISNAIRHGGGSAPVAVTASLTKDRRGVSKEELLMVHVRDHGPGIPEDKLEDIFNPFYRLEGGSGKTGLGLGLALVKSIITIMKGEIHIRSKPGKGTTATFTVPVDGGKNTPSRRVG